MHRSWRHWVSPACHLNLNQLAKSANMGTLDVSQNVELQLQEAYLAILAMRDALITALEIKLR